MTDFKWMRVGMFVAFYFLFAISSGPFGSKAYGAHLPMERELASKAFPQHKLTSDVGDIMDDYPEYLEFALEIGRRSDPRVASMLSRKYEALRSRDKAGAARFLRGLRFEMVQKLELLGVPPRQITSDTPVMRRWVAKYLREWLREADEYLFRSYTGQLARRSE